ncbi:MAG: alpha/beta fold hydrolase [Burkholderiaceae bacterium]
MSVDLHCLAEGPADAPIVVLSHALGCDLHMWDWLVPRLTPHLRVLRYDHRGHGRSSPAEGPYPIEALAEDAAALIERRAGGRPVHFVGLSMGGMTAQALAASRPELLASVTIANSAAHYPDTSTWAARIETVRREGVAAVADGAIERWLTPSFRATPEGADAAARLHRTLCANDATQYEWASGAVAGIDLRAGNRAIGVPALVIAGKFDEGTPVAMSEQIAEAIPGARMETLAAAHLSAVECPDAFSRLVLAMAG